MANCTDRLTPIMQALLNCANERLVSCGRPVCRASLVPGAQAVADMCCGCDDADGQLWVLVKSITAEPVAPGIASCGFSFSAELEVGVFRCSIALTESGEAPTAQELDDEATGILLDAAIIREAVVCCFPAAADLGPMDWMLGSANALGPLGGCSGWAQGLTTRFTDCACT